MPNIAHFHPQIVHFAIALLLAGVVMRWISLTGKVAFAGPAATTALLLLGNPPWVRGERLPARVREVLSQRYSTWRSGVGPFAHVPDLSVAFCARALELLAPGGVVALLAPAKLATAGYAETLRRRLANETRLERVAPLDESAAASFRAAVYPMALVAARRSEEHTSE